MPGTKTAAYLKFHFFIYILAILLNTFFAEQIYVVFMILSLELAIIITLSQSPITATYFHRVAHKHSSKNIKGFLRTTSTSRTYSCEKKFFEKIFSHENFFSFH